MQFENLTDWLLRIILWPLQSYEILWKRTSKSQSLPHGLWSANDLEKLLDQIPAELNKFHLVLFTGSESPYCSQRARSGGVCKSRYLPGKIYLQPLELPKHFILSLELHHMFQSRQLTFGLLYRLGHTESYDFTLELEMAIANANEASSDLLSTKTVRNPKKPSVFHSN